MRLSHIILIILLLPPLWVGGSDMISSNQNSTKLTEASTLGDVWVHVHQESFMKFRSHYLGRPDAWKTEVLPYLEIKAVPVLLGPGILWGVFLLLGRIFGWRSYGGRERFSDPTSPFARGHIHSKQHNFKYKRK